MNVLAIGAHFDDVELGCGGALAKHVQNGDKVYVYVATHSGFSNPEGVVIRHSEEALEEGKEAVHIIGAELICGEFETLQLEFTEQLNAQIVDIIEKYNIDQIYTHWIGDSHHDHIALAQASLHAARRVKRVLMYRSNWYHSAQNFIENFYVDISSTWELKKRAIFAYKSEYKRVGDKWVNYFYREALNNGEKMGVNLAEVFQVVKWLQ